MQRFPFSRVWAEDSKVFLADRGSTLPAHEPSLVFAMDRKFGSVFLPSVVHGLAPVIADVNLRNIGLL